MKYSTAVSSVSHRGTALVPGRAHTSSSLTCLRKSNSIFSFALPSEPLASSTHTHTHTTVTRSNEWRQGAFVRLGGRCEQAMRVLYWPGCCHWRQATHLKACGGTSAAKDRTWSQRTSHFRSRLQVRQFPLCSVGKLTASSPYTCTVSVHSGHACSGKSSSTRCEQRLCACATRC
jgi:hypothetical protein